MESGGERAVKRRRTDDSPDQDASRTTPAVFAQPLRWQPAGTVLPVALKNQGGSDWAIQGKPVYVVVCAHDEGCFVGCSSSIVRVSSDGVVSPVAGDPRNKDDADGVGDAARFSEYIYGLALSSDGATLFVADTTRSGKWTSQQVQSLLWLAAE